MKSKKDPSKTKKCYDLMCSSCGMSISVRTTEKCPGSDVLFVCCGEAMKVKR